MRLPLYFAITISALAAQFSTVQSNRGNSCSSVNCGSHSECVEIGNEGVCQCLPGFFSNTGSQRDCVDRNECLLMPCGTYSTCTNNDGSYQCRCFGGFVSDDDGVNCRPSNRQLDCNFGHTCGRNSRCARTSVASRSHRCYCEKGYYVVSQRNCPDRNECSILANNGACPPNSRCENLQGTYRCDCKDGFEKDSSARCVDVDECNNNPCGANSACLNTYGSYKCECFAGYKNNDGSGKNCVVDPNADPETREQNSNKDEDDDASNSSLRKNCNTATVIAAVTCAVVGVLIIAAIIYFIIKQHKKTEERPKGATKNGGKHIDSISGRLFYADSTFGRHDDGMINMAFDDTDSASTHSSAINDKKAGFDFVHNNNYDENDNAKVKLDSDYLAPPPYTDFDEKISPFAFNDNQFEAKQPSEGETQTVIAEINQESVSNDSATDDAKPIIPPKPIYRREPHPLLAELKSNDLFQVHERENDTESRNTYKFLNGHAPHYNPTYEPTTTGHTGQMHRLTDGHDYGMTNGYITPTYSEVSHVKSEKTTAF